MSMTSGGTFGHGETEGRELSETEVLSLLEDLLRNETAQKASDSLKHYVAGISEDPGPVVRFMFILSRVLLGNSETAVRQLAGVLLRKRIGSAYPRMTLAEKREFQQSLVQGLGRDGETHSVRAATAHAVAEILKHESKSEWGRGLINSLLQSVEAPEPSRREVCHIVLTAVMEGNRSDVSRYSEIVAAFTKGMGDTYSRAVQQQALRGLSYALLKAEDKADFVCLQKALPSIADYLEKSLGSADYTDVQLALEVLNDYVEYSDVLTNSEISQLITVFMNAIATDEDVPIGVREQCLSFVDMACLKRPATFKKHPEALNAVLKGLVTMGRVPDEYEFVEKETVNGKIVSCLDTWAQDEATPFGVAGRTLDNMATHLPDQLIFPKVMEMINPLANSDNVYDKRCALVFVGLMSEGCEEIMRKNLDAIMPFQLSCLRETSPVVRSAAGLAVGQMAEFLKPDISRHAETALLMCMEALNATIELIGADRSAKNERKAATNELVAEKLTYAIDMLCDSVDYTVIGVILPQLLPLLIRCLAETNTLQSKDSILSTLGSLALSAKTQFVPYSQGVLELLKNELLIAKDSGMVNSMHCRAIECCGSIAVAIGGTLFEPHRQLVSTCIVELLVRHCLGDDVGSAALSSNPELVNIGDRKNSTDSGNAGEIVVGTGLVHELRSASYRFVCMMVSTYREEYLPYLPVVMPFIFASIFCADAIQSEADDRQILEDLPVDVLGGERSSEFRDGMSLNFAVMNDAVNEVVSALECLCSIIKNIRLSLIERIADKTIKVIEEVRSHFNESIRQLASTLMSGLVIGQHEINPPYWWKDVNQIYDEDGNLIRQEIKLWSRGFPCNQYCLTDATLQLWDSKFWPLVSDMLTNDTVMSSLTCTMEMLSGLIDLLGPDLLSDGSPAHNLSIPKIELISQCALKVLTNTHPCQRSNYEDALDDEAQYSKGQIETLFEAMVSVVSSCAQVMGPQLVPPFFSRLHPLMYKMASHKTSKLLKTIGIGCYGELLQTLSQLDDEDGGNNKNNNTDDEPPSSPTKNIATQYLQAILPVVKDCLSAYADDELDSLKRNSVFCLGTIFEGNPTHPDVLPNLTYLYSKIINILQLQQKNKPHIQMLFSEEKCCIDNTASCLSKLLRHAPYNVFCGSPPMISLDQAAVAFLNALPLKEDFLETPEVARGLIHVYFKLVGSDFIKTHFALIIWACLKTITDQNQSKILGRIKTLSGNSTLLVDLKGVVFAALNLLLPEAALPPQPVGSLFPQALANHYLVVDLVTRIGNDQCTLNVLKGFFAHQ